ncbi:threonine/serine dehydratase [Cupriavidus necator]|jgi:threonine dehydratase|uniref:threonine/serine dehydratase n=1 Tax=Cupriavidus necator TaxID=106590 RepID=UPI00059DC6CF|nr:threonine/serine dehydratase [Cupriavidus necator]MDX6008354.1 threonine/serine dehydratase [Cupriavidus necator]
MITRDDIQRAASRISPYVRVTPILQVEPQDGSVPGNTFLKLESLQVTGSFKPRGAFNRLLGEPLPAAGVIAASGGNHGIAVAYAARKLGTKAEIYVPSLTTPLKRAMLDSMGATTVVAGSTYVEALAASEARAAETGAMQVPAFEHLLTIAGQGTIGLELEQQIEKIDTVMVAVGGGGFAAGIASYLDPRIKIVSVEPRSCPTLERALSAGHPVDVETGGLAADSLGCRRVGDIAFPILQERVSESVLVSDEQIRDAQAFLWAEYRIVAEPGGAVAFAAVTSGAYKRKPGESIVIIICGGNADPCAIGSGK